eukprot:m.294443 g.294443  ORF g.294443 m.294443 type:complete len:85 (+) comp19502_c1_seq1:148-402(+)
MRKQANVIDSRKEALKQKLDDDRKKREAAKRPGEKRGCFGCVQRSRSCTSHGDTAEMTQQQQLLVRDATDVLVAPTVLSTALLV